MSPRLATALVVGLVAAILGVAIPATGVLDGLERQSVDARFAVRGDRAAPSSVAMVRIDDASIHELGSFPFPRAAYAPALRNLKAAGAAAIVVDVQFSEPSARGPADDRALLRAISAARPVILGTTAVRDGRPVLFASAARLRAAGAHVGDADFAVPDDGVFRRVPHDVEGVKHLDVVAAEVVRGRPLPASDFDDGGAWIDYRGGSGTVPSISLSQARSGDFPAALVRGRVVVIGATAGSLNDVHATSVDDTMSGPEINAQAIATLLDGIPLRDTPWWAGWLLVLAAGLVAPLAGSAQRGGRSLVAALAGAILGGALLLAGVQLAFGAGHVLPLTGPLLALAVGGSGAVLLAATTEIRDRRRVREAFERFVPAQVVGEVLATADDGRLAGARLEATVLFCDLRGFTAWAETVEPERVIATLDRYSAEMTEGVAAHGGTVVTYLGDGLMAVFGAPLPQADHADRALAAARELAGARIAAFNAAIDEAPFGFGVGLNSGTVMSGTVGSGQRLEYVVVGDTTNVAARVQALTRETGHVVLLTGATHAALREHPDDLVEVGELAVRDHAPVRAWTLRG